MIIVQKYGGSSVATPEKLKRVAELIVARRRAGDELVVVVSAMGDTTDELLTLAKKITPSPPRRELDMLVSCGERISMALLAMAIHTLGEEAISFTGSQSGIITTTNHFAAKIVEVRPQRIIEALKKNHIVIVAGYQGMSVDREITTLGRGGSDTTAVALAAALNADACEIYSDVDGVYSADPRIVADASRIPAMSYEEMETFAGAGAKVLNADAVAFAKHAGIVIHAKKTDSPGEGTRVEAKPPNKRAVAGVAVKTDVVLVQHAALDWSKLGNARIEGFSQDERGASFWLDLENCADPDAFKGTPCDVVSLVGEHLPVTLVQKALALLPKNERVVVEPHRIAACVKRGDGAALANVWHAECVAK